MPFSLGCFATESLMIQFFMFSDFINLFGVPMELILLLHRLDFWLGEAIMALSASIMHKRLYQEILTTVLCSSVLNTQVTKSYVHFPAVSYLNAAHLEIYFFCNFNNYSSCSIELVVVHFFRSFQIFVCVLIFIFFCNNVRC